MFAVSTLKQVFGASSRKFSTVCVSRQDSVKDLFLKELKSYKPSALAGSGDVAQAKDFKMPTPPQAPKFDEDIASELATYDQASA